jgi:hypothetical protein
VPFQKAPYACLFAVKRKLQDACQIRLPMYCHVPAGAQWERRPAVRYRRQPRSQWRQPKLSCVLLHPSPSKLLALYMFVKSSLFKQA